MKSKYFIAFFLLMGIMSSSLFAQNVSDYKTKTKSNSVERTQILDIVRASLYEDYQQEFIFVVNKLNVASGYAWFQGDAQRKDGKKVRVNDWDDCCHVEALLKKSNGKWHIVRMVAFSTDVWWEDLADETGAPSKIFWY